jgi:hypothetical protein
MVGAVLNSPEDICNAALAQIGYKRRIGSLYDGSEAAAIALDIYSQARDAKLRSFPWGFAERQATLTLLKTAPVGGYSPVTPWTSANPLQPFIYEYSYPQDMLELRALRGTGGQIPNFDPRPKLWRIANDTVAAVQQKVILSNLANAAAIYTGQVTDPTLWEPAFTDGFIATLGKLLSAGLASVDMTKMEAQEEAVETQGAEMTLG